MVLFSAYDAAYFKDLGHAKTKLLLKDILEALESDAFSDRLPVEKKAICDIFKGALRYKNDLTISMEIKGKPYQNAFVGAFLQSENKFIGKEEKYIYLGLLSELAGSHRLEESTSMAAGKKYAGIVLSLPEGEETEKWYENLAAKGASGHFLYNSRADWNPEMQKIIPSLHKHLTPGNPRFSLIESFACASQEISADTRNLAKQQFNLLQNMPLKINKNDISSTKTILQAQLALVPVFECS